MRLARITAAHRAAKCAGACPEPGPSRGAAAIPKRIVVDLAARGSTLDAQLAGGAQQADDRKGVHDPTVHGRLYGVRQWHGSGDHVAFRAFALGEAVPQPAREIQVIHGMDGGAAEAGSELLPAVGAE